MSRMRLLSESATAMAPFEGITATPAGEKNLAAVPVPSANSCKMPPASDLTTAPATASGNDTSRIRNASPTTIVRLEGITATPVGEGKFTFVPVPSPPLFQKLPLPASVVTVPRGVTSRMRWFEPSATTITPLEGITATPLGNLNLAAALVPSTQSGVPLPASVETIPEGDTRRMR